MSAPTVMEASLRFVAVFPRYFGLAMPLKGEEQDFNAAEHEVAIAFLALQRAIKQTRRSS